MTLEADRTFGTPDMAENTAMLRRMARPLTSADIMDALETEIHRKYKDEGGVKAFSAAIGVDYRTYRRYLRGERQMTTDLLMGSLAFLQVDPVFFFMQLRERLEQEQLEAGQ